VLLQVLEDAEIVLEHGAIVTDEVHVAVKAGDVGGELVV